MNRFLRKTAITMVAFGVVAFCSPSVAKAATITFDLTGDHCTGGCGTPPFGTVTLTTVGSNLDVLVHLLNGNKYAKTGAVDFQAFKFNATGITLADITIDTLVPGLAASTGAFNGDGTGTFAYGIGCPACGNGASSAFGTDIEFHVANASIADLTAPNALGVIFVADLLSAQTGNTGPVFVAAPEPASLLLLSTGIFGVGAFARRRKAKK